MNEDTAMEAQREKVIKGLAGTYAEDEFWGIGEGFEKGWHARGEHDAAAWATHPDRLNALILAAVRERERDEALAREALLIGIGCYECGPIDCSCCEERKRVSPSATLLLALGRAAVRECRSHNSRGSDGPCDCPQCRAVDAALADDVLASVLREPS